MRIVVLIVAVATTATYPVSARPIIVIGYSNPAWPTRGYKINGPNVTSPVSVQNTFVTSCTFAMAVHSSQRNGGEATIDFLLYNHTGYPLPFLSQLTLDFRPHYPTLHSV